MTKRKINLALAMALTLMAAATGRSASGAEPMSADELFAVFVDARSSITFDNSIAQYEDPRFYTRAWLEDAIKSALNAAKQAERPGLNWAQDSLLAKLSATMSVRSVYDYQLIQESASHASLQMHVTDACKRPATYTVEFSFEDGAWRIARTNHDSSKTGQAWFKADLKPVKEFPNITLRDRARYFNESTLGMSLGLNVADHRCSAPTDAH